jgi:fibronectin-binding autotransporter adhesin
MSANRLMRNTGSIFVLRLALRAVARRPIGVLTACSLLLGCAGVANAQLSAFLATPNLSSTRNDSFMAGWGFYTNSSGNVQVDQLGFFVPSGETTSVSHAVALYDYNGSNYSLVTQATIPAGTSVASGGYAWVNIPTITLTNTGQGGDYYILMANFSTTGSDVWTNGNAGEAVANSSFGTPTGNAWYQNALATGGSFPATESLVHTTNGGFVGPNIGYASISTLYWTGTSDGTWTNANNWASDAAGITTSTAAPSSINSVTFSASGATNLNTKLVSNFSIGSLSFTTSSAVTIGGSNTLTLGGGSLSVSSGAGADVINSTVALATGQSWINSSTNALTVNGAVSGGAAQALNFGGGTFTLAGSNTYTGPTAITSGTLQIGNGGSGEYLASSAISNSGVLVFNHADSLAYSGAISGGGALQKTGTGILTLGGVNTFTGGTIVSGGTLAFGAVPGGGAGNLRGSLTVSPGATVAAANSWNLGYTSGTCVSTIAVNQGMMTFTSTPGQGGTAASSVTLNGGTISGGGGGNTFDWYNGITNNPTLSTVASSIPSIISANINLRLGATTNNLTFNVAPGTTSNGIDLMVSGNIGQTASGGIIKAGAGVMEITGADTYNGATSITAGTLMLGGSGNLGGGSYNQVIANSGAFVLNTSSNQTFAGAISGPGALYQLGNATVTLTGSNTYSGGTFINGATLQIGNGGNTGSIPSAGTSSISNNGVLALNRSDSVTWAAAINGTGSLFQTGGGSLTLSGSSGYSGATTVNAGMLLLSNTGSNNIAASSLITLNSAGTLNVNGLAGGSGLTLSGSQTLRGLGTVLGSITASSGATVLAGTGNATGSGIGTLTVGGSLNFAPGAAVADYLGTPGLLSTSPGTAGLIKVPGTLTLPNSGLNLSLLNNSNAGNLGIAGNGWYELFSYGSLSGNPSAAFPATLGAKQFTYVSGAGQIDVDVQILALNWAGTASSSWDTVGSTNWANSSTATAASYIDGANVTFSDTNSLTGGTVSNSNVVIQAAGVQPNSVTFSNNAVTYTLSNAGGTAGIAGTTGIVLSGSGTVNLQSPNSFSGVVAVNSGILNISNSAALGTGGVTVAAGGALQIQGNIAVAAVPLSLNGSGFAASPAGALNSVSGTNSYAGAVTLSGPSSIVTSTGLLTLTGSVSTAGNLLTMGGAGNTTIATLGISGTGGLAVAGPGTTILAAVNTSSGATPTINLNGGVLQMPAWTSGASTTFNFNGGTLQANASSAAFLGATPANVNNINAGGAVIDSQAYNITITQPFSGVGALTKIGAGRLTLGATSSYAGPTIVSAGVLQLGPVLPATPVVRYPFDGTANDASGNGNNATVQNGPATYNTGVFGQATTLNGANQYLTAPYNSSLALSGSFTVSTWVNFNSQPGVNVNGGPTLFSTRNGGEHTFDLQYYQPTAGNYQLHSDIGNGSGWIYTSANDNLSGPLSGWNMVTLVVTSSSYTYYLNGALAAFGTYASGTPQLMTSSETLSLGAQESGGGVYGGSGYLNGSLDEANIFSGTLTAAQVQTLYQGQGGQLPAATPLTINSGATFDLNSYSQQVASLSGSGAVTNSGGGSVTLTLSSTASGISTYSGTIQNGGGTVSLVVNGASGFGEFLTGVNTFSGSVSVASGSLYLANSGALVGATLTSSGVYFDQSVASHAFTIGGLSGSSTLALSDDAVTPNPIALTVGANNQSTTFSGSITNGSAVGGSFTKVGSGILILGGSNTYTGGTFINGGELGLSSSGAIPQPGNVTFGGGTLQFSANNTTDISASIVNSSGPIAIDTNGQVVTFGGTLASSNSGGLTKIGLGTLVLAASNAYTGTTTLAGGTLGLANIAAIPAGGTLTFTGGALQYSASNTFDYSNQIKNSTASISIDTNSQSVNYAGTLDASNSGGLTKLGGGTLILSGSNSYSGGTYVYGGVLSLGNSAALPLAATPAGGYIYFAGGTLQYSASNTRDYSPNIVVSDGPIAIDTNGQNVKFASPLSNSNVGGLAKIGAGSLTLTANNDFGGGTTVSGGTLQLGDGVANAGSVPGNIALANNSALVFATPSGPTQAYGGVISGSGSLTMNGPGTLQLTANHTYTGPTAINAGTLQLGVLTSASGFGADTSGTAGSNSTWTVNTSGNVNVTAITGGSLTLTDNTGSARSAFLNTPVAINTPFSVNFTYHLGTATTGSYIADGMMFVLQNAGTGALGTGGGGLGYGGITPSIGVGFNIYSFATPQGIVFGQNGAISPSATTGSVNVASLDPIQVNLNYDGSNNLVATLTDLSTSLSYSATDAVGSLAGYFGGSNTAYVGFTGGSGAGASLQTISDFNYATAFGGSTNILPATTALSISGGTLDLFGSNQTVASLSGSGMVTNTSAATTSVLTTGGDNTSQTFAGMIADNAGFVGLTKTGTGGLTLTGSNAYSGPTTISGGTLTAGAAFTLSASSAVTVGAPSGSGVLDVTAAPQIVSGLTIGAAGAVNINDLYPLAVSGSTSFAPGSSIDIVTRGIVTPDLLMTYLSSTGTLTNVYVNGSLGLPGGDSLSYSGGSLEIISNGAASGGTWTQIAGGSWTMGSNWSSNPTPPMSGTVAFPELSSTSAIAVTLDAPQSAGALVFSATEGYALAPGTSGSLTLGTSAGGSITVLAGANTISAPLLLAGSLDIAPASGSQLTISGNIQELSPGTSLTLSDNGTLILGGNNGYTGGTNVVAGTLVLDTSTALADGSSLTVGQGASSLFAPAAGPAIAAPAGAIAAVPEPGTLLLLLTGLGCGAACRRAGRVACLKRDVSR